MPIYLIRRTDDVHWDQDAGHVIIAETAEQALTVAREDSPNQPASVWDSADVTELNPDGEPGIVLTDFNAGWRGLAPEWPLGVSGLLKATLVAYDAAMQ